MKSEIRDSWDGYDKKEYAYDDRKEKSFQARVWIVLACVMGFVLVYLLVDHVRELYWMENGTAVEAAYDEKNQIARFKDTEGRWHMLDMSGYYPVRENGHVWLYYMSDPDAAKPRESALSRLLSYSFFGVLFALCTWRICVIYNRKKRAF